MQLKICLVAAVNLGGGGVYSGMKQNLVYRFRSLTLTPSPNLFPVLKTDKKKIKYLYQNPRIFL